MNELTMQENEQISIFDDDELENRRADAKELWAKIRYRFILKIIQEYHLPDNYFENKEEVIDFLKKYNKTVNDIRRMILDDYYKEIDLLKTMIALSLEI